MGLTTSSEIIDRLRSTVAGRVIDPRDPDYDTLRAGVYGAGLPAAAIVQPADATDVSRVVSLAAEHDIELAVRCGGHSVAQHSSTDGGILLDMSSLKGIEIDAAKRTARVEAGVRWADLLPETGRYDLTGLCGSSSDPSVVGYTVGGGLSWFSRKHGLAADSVRAFEVLDAEGDPARVTAETDPGLFWALRGGGGDFALVTALEMDLYPAAEIFGGQLIWPAERAEEVLAAYREVVATAPEELAVWFTLMTFPPLPELPPFLSGRSVVSVQTTYLGDAGTAQALLGPLRRIGGTLVDALRPVPVPELDSVAAEPADPMPSTEYSLLLPQLDDVTAKALLGVAGPGSGSPWSIVQLRHLGGALRRAGAGAGATGAIDEEFGFCAIGVAVPPMIEALDAHKPVLAAAMEPHSSGRRLFNFLTSGEPASLAFDPATLGRLRAIKADRDPHAVFRSNRPVGV